MPPKFLYHGSVSLDTPVLGMCNSTVVRLHNGGVFTTAGSINEKKLKILIISYMPLLPQHHPDTFMCHLQCTPKMKAQPVKIFTSFLMKYFPQRLNRHK